MCNVVKSKSSLQTMAFCLILVILTVSGLSNISAYTVSATNLVLDGEFEGSGPVLEVNGCTSRIITDPTEAGSSNHVLEVTYTGSGNQLKTRAELGLNKTYYYSARLYRPAGSDVSTANLWANYVKNGQTSSNSTTITSNFPLVEGQWVTIGTFFQLSADTDIRKVEKIYICPGAAGIVYIDDVSIKEVTDTDHSIIPNYGFENEVAPKGTNIATASNTAEKSKDGIKSLKVVEAQGDSKITVAYNPSLTGGATYAISAYVSCDSIVTPRLVLNYWGTSGTPGQKTKNYDLSVTTSTTGWNHVIGQLVMPADYETISGDLSFTPNITFSLEGDTLAHTYFLDNLYLGDASTIPTATPIPTPTATPTTTPTATPIVTPPPGDDGNLLVNSDFEDGIGSPWGVGEGIISSVSVTQNGAGAVQHGEKAALVTNRVQKYSTPSQWATKNVTKGKTYYYSGWVKKKTGSSESANFFLDCRNAADATPAARTNALVKSDTISTSVWTQFSGIYTVTTAHNVDRIRPYFETTTLDEMYFDNFELVELSDLVVSSSSNVDNLAVDSDIVLDFSVKMNLDTLNTGSITISNDAVIDQIIKNDTDHKSCTLQLRNNLDFNKTYTVTINGAEDSYGRTINNVSLNFRTTPVCNIIGQKFYTGYGTAGQNDITNTGIVNGLITAESVVKNNAPTQTPIFMMVALYDGTVLVNVACTDVNKKIAGNAEETIKVDMQVPTLTGHDYNLKCFLWNSILEMQPLKVEKQLRASR